MRGIVVALLTPLLSPVGSGEALSRVPVMCLGRVATAVGTARNDLLVGGSGRDVIAGRGGADVIRGRGGPDLLCGGPGNDLLVGGRGPDVLDGGGGSDDLRGQVGRDDLIGRAGDDSLRGGSGADALFGGPGGDLLRAGAHDDLLLGGPGNDDLRGGEGLHDLASFPFAAGPVQVDLSAGLATGEGSDLLSRVEDGEGSDHDDVLRGDEAPNLLRGGVGDDSLEAAAGPDELDGGRGDDLLDGGGGADLASFLAAVGPVEVDLAAGTASGQGTDTLLAMEDLTGSAFDDMLRGDGGPNYLNGHFGDDRLEGQTGDDELSGGFGSDMGDGGPGTDFCWADIAQQTDCEESGVYDLEPVTHIVQPLHGQELHSVRRVAGQAWDGAFGEIRSVTVAVRLLTPRGCLWLRAPRERLEHRPCEAPLWNRAEYAQGQVGGPWSLGFPALPDGSYQGRSRAVGVLHPDQPYRERYFRPGWNLAEFRVI